MWPSVQCVCLWHFFSDLAVAVSQLLSLVPENNSEFSQDQLLELAKMGDSGTEEQLPTIADDLVVTKYKMAAEITNSESE